MHRLPGGSMGGRWEFPGGKCERGESLREALVREWLEETGLSVSTGNELGRSCFQHKGKDFTLVAYEVFLPDAPADTPAEPDLIEHDQWRWVSIPDIPDLNLVDSDRALFENLQRKGVF